MSDTEDTTAEAQAADAPATEAQAATGDDFDKDRAMATINKLRAFEREAKAKLRRLDELEQADQAKKDAELSEAQKLRKEMDILRAQHESATAELRRAKLLQAAQRAAEKAQIAFHPGAIEDALKLGAFDDLEWDGDQPKGLGDAIRTLAKDRPYLTKPLASGADLDARARGTTSKQDEEARRLEKNATRWGILLGKQG